MVDSDAELGQLLDLGVLEDHGMAAMSAPSTRDRTAYFSFASHGRRVRLTRASLYSLKICSAVTWQAVGQR
jgi:hypothetical protein